MLHMIEGESIGMKQEVYSPLQALMPNQFKIPSGEPWLAVIKGKCQKYGFKREFVREDRFSSHARSNGTGSRGVWTRWFIDTSPGVIYEFYRKTSWRSSERYFFHFVDGQKVKLERDQVCQILQSRLE